MGWAAPGKWLLGRELMWESGNALGPPFTREHPPWPPEQKWKLRLSGQLIQATFANVW